MAQATRSDAHQESAVPYGVTYLGLLALTITTFLLSRKDFGIWSFVIAMAIAVTKASLVVLIFMQLWHHRGSPRLALATALAWLALLMVFVLADVHTRFPLANPSNNPIEGPAGPAPSNQTTGAGQRTHP
jgi:cytochrome c oxidase subunit IV